MEHDTETNLNIGHKNTPLDEVTKRMTREESVVEELLKASDSLIREISINAPLKVARPVAMSEVIERIKKRILKRTLVKNNGSIPVWTPEYEDCDKVYYYYSEEGLTEETRDFGTTNKHEVNERQVETEKDEIDKKRHFDAQEVDGSSQERQEYNKDIESITTDEEPYSMPNEENEDQAETLSMHNIQVVQEEGEEADKIKSNGKSETSVYLQMLRAEMQKKPGSIYFDEEAEEEGLDFPNGIGEVEHEEVGTAAQLIKEVQEIIDDDDSKIEDKSNSLHRSLLAQQLVEESVEESELIAQIIEEKKENRLTNLKLKQKYGKKNRAQEPKFLEYDDSNIELSDTEERFEFLRWKSENAPISAPSKPITFEVNSFHSSLKSSLPRRPLIQKKRSSEEVLRMLSASDSKASTFLKKI